MTSKKRPFKKHKDDMALNRWHREHGYDLPCTNVDWFVHYDLRIPKALIEFKRLSAPRFDPNNANYQVLRRVANAESPIPFYEILYAQDMSEWVLIPQNDLARSQLGNGKKENWLSEAGYIRFLHWVRRQSG